MAKNKYFDDELIHEILKPYAYKVFKDLSNESHRVIDEFYRDYTPDIYERTYGMKNLFSPKLIKTKKGYNVEFTYSAEYLTTEHRSDEAVFEGSFVHGWHGGEYYYNHKKKEVPRMQPSPWTQIELFVKTYKI